MLSVIWKVTWAPTFDIGPTSVLGARWNAQNRAGMGNFPHLGSLTMTMTIWYVCYTGSSSAPCLLQNEHTSN